MLEGLDELVGRDEFNAALCGVVRGRRWLERRVARVTAGALHLLNLPAASDIDRVVAHLSALTGEVRELRRREGC
ncbi:MAG: hypothetical protein ACREQ5_39800 [Candidatus Dormibacteria bacterium]